MSNFQEKLARLLEEKSAVKTPQRGLTTPEVRMMLRKKARVSQKDCGKLLGIPTRTFGAWEQGQNKVPSTHFRRYQELLQAFAEATGMDAPGLGEQADEEPATES